MSSTQRTRIFTGDDFGSREKKLAKRLEQRSYDVRAMAKLIDAAYERQHYLIAADSIKKALMLGGFNGLLYQRLAKCYFRAFSTSRKAFPDANLQMALDAYKAAMRDPKIRRGETPVPYFEVLSIFVLLGQYQAALDVLGAVTTFYKSQTSWIIIAQYNIAQILVLLGKLTEAEQIYRELMLTPTVVSVDPGPDNIVFVSTSLTNIYITLEMSLLLRRQNASKLSDDLLQETWGRVEKYGDVICGGQRDLRVGKLSVAQWLNDADTYNSLGYIFLSNYNSAMAAEMFGKAAQMLQTEMETSYYDREKLDRYVEALLQRADVLTRCGAFDLAEESACKAFQVAPKDPVVVCRAANCCRIVNAKNNNLLVAADHMRQHFRRIAYVFYEALRKRHRRQRLHENLCATKINSVIRMILSRNRTVGLRLGSVSSGQIGVLVRSLRWGLLRTGRQQLEDWLEIWNMSSRAIQMCVRRHERRRRQVMQSRGTMILQSLFRGQRLRRSLRFYFTTLKMAEVSSSTKDDINNRSVATPHSHSHSYLSTSRLIEPESVPSIYIKEEKFHRGVCCGSTFSDAGDGGYKAEGTLNALDNIFAESKSMGLKPSQICSADAGASSAIQQSMPSAGTVGDKLSIISIRSAKQHSDCQWVPFGIVSDEDVLTMLSCRALAIASPSFRICDCMRLIRLLLLPTTSSTSSTAETATITLATLLNGPEVGTQQESKYEPLKSLSDHRPHSGRQRSTMSTNTQRDNHNQTRWMNIRSLIVGRTSMGPLGLLKLLKLGITHLESLAINGVGMRGVFGEIIGKAFIPLDFHHLTKNSRYGYLAAATSTSTTIMKIFIEEEPKFGDSGFTELVKYLQYCPSLRVLVVRRCMLSSKSTKAAARLVSVGPSLEDVVLNGNRFSSRDCRLMLTSVANRGARGRLQRVSVEDQDPPLSKNDVLELYQLGCKLSVRVESDLLHATDVLSLRAQGAGCIPCPDCGSGSDDHDGDGTNYSLHLKSDLAVIDRIPVESESASGRKRRSINSEAPKHGMPLINSEARRGSPQSKGHFPNSFHRSTDVKVSTDKSASAHAATSSYLSFDDHDWTNIHDVFEELQKNGRLHQLEGLKFTKRLYI